MATRPPADALAAAAELVLRLAGVVVPEYRWPVIGVELHALGGDRGIPAGLERVAAGDPAARQALLEAVTIPESYFFRHPRQFELLHRIAAERARRGLGTSVLSAGCSTGEEAWSAAAVLASVEGGGATEHSVVGWDLSPARLDTARTGCYRPWSCRIGLLGYDAQFEREGDLVWVAPRLRRMVRFERVNLVDKTWPPLAPVDAILLRNVSIYWTSEVAAAACRRLVGLLAPGGVLLPGPTDPVELPRDRWRQTFDGNARCYRRVEPAAVEAAAAPRPRPEAGARRPAPPRVEASPRPTPSPAAAAGVRRTGDEAEHLDLLEAVRRLADEGRYAEARRRLEAVPRPTAEMRGWRGVLALAEDRHEEAICLFRQCVFLAPERLDYRRWLAAAYEAAGRLAEAERERRNLVEAGG